MTQEQALVKAEDLKNIVEQVKILFPHLKKVSDAEIIKAIKLSKELGLNPIEREVHFVPYGNSVQLIVSYLEYIKRAERSGKLDGWKIRYGKDDIGEYAEVIIHRKDWSHPFEWRTYLKEAKRNTPIWKEMPLFMLKKTAIAQAFRICFPEELSHLPYEEAELVNHTSEPATQSQKNYIIDLLASRNKDLDYLESQFGKTIDEITKSEASEIIEHLKNLPNSPEVVEEIENPQLVEADDEDVPF